MLRAMGLPLERIGPMAYHPSVHPTLKTTNNDYCPATPSQHPHQKNIGISDEELNASVYDHATQRNYESITRIALNLTKGLWNAAQEDSNKVESFLAIKMEIKNKIDEMGLVPQIISAKIDRDIRLNLNTRYEYDLYCTDKNDEADLKALVELKNEQYDLRSHTLDIRVSRVDFFPENPPLPETNRQQIYVPSKKDVEQLVKYFYALANWAKGKDSVHFDDSPLAGLRIKKPRGSEWLLELLWEQVIMAEGVHPDRLYGKDKMFGPNLDRRGEPGLGSARAAVMKSALEIYWGTTSQTK